MSLYISLANVCFHAIGRNVSPGNINFELLVERTLYHYQINTFVFFHMLETAYFTSKQNRETRCIDVKI